MRSFKEIVEGKHDDLPEAAFLMVGTIEEAREKAEKMKTKRLMPVELEIVSPTKLVLSRPVDMVVMPGYEGDIAAMEQHAPMIVLLRGGIITLHEGGTPHRPLLRRWRLC